MIVFLGLTSIILSAWLTRLFSHSSARFQMLDFPNERSLHERPTPRSGGVAIVASVFSVGVMGAIAFRAPPLLLWIWLGALAIAVVSFLDDRMNFSPLYRLLVHVVAAWLLVYADVGFSTLSLPGIAWVLPMPAAVVISLLFVVWMVNLYNFMDGMDGFAGGMAVFGFGVFAVMGWMAEHDMFFFISLIVAAASAGFLIFNFPPARIFMGELDRPRWVSLRALSLWGARDGVFLSGLRYWYFRLLSWMLRQRFSGVSCGTKESGKHTRLIITSNWCRRGGGIAGRCCLNTPSCSVAE